jgi:hypothetical protein
MYSIGEYREQITKGFDRVSLNYWKSLLFIGAKIFYKLIHGFQDLILAPFSYHLLFFTIIKVRLYLLSRCL